MVLALGICIIIVILIYSYTIIDRGETSCKESYNRLQEVFLERYQAVENLCTYVSIYVREYQKPMVNDFKQLRVENKVRSYEVEHLETYVTQTILDTIKVAQASSELDKGQEYEDFIDAIHRVEEKINFALIDCNEKRRIYNRKLHNFPIILFAKFYGYNDMPKIQIPLALVAERGKLN